VAEYWKKNMALFLTGQIISLFGSSLVQFALSWYVTLETQSGVMLTGAVVCGFLPAFLVSPFAGVWADRYDRKKLIIFADTLVALAAVGILVAFRFGLADMRLIFAVMAVRGLGQGIQQPAVNALVPLIVPDDNLMRVNGILGSAQSAMMLLAPAFSGALMTFASMYSIFFIDIITAALGIALLAIFVHAPKTPKAALPDEKVGILGDLRLGIRYIAGHKVVRLLFVFNTALTILSAPAAMLCNLQVTRLFGADAWRLSLADIGFALGVTLGGIALATFGGFKNRHSTISLGNYVFAVTTILFGVMDNFWVFIAVMGICGIGLPLCTTPLTVLMQETVEPRYMGRVFSFNSMVLSLGMPLGLLLFGPLADLIGLGLLFVMTGVVQFAISVLFTMNGTLCAAGQPKRRL
jgi:DHA3 family macrolide efflux protein-like MFS transporter